MLVLLETDHMAGSLMEFLESCQFTLGLVAQVFLVAQILPVLSAILGVQKYLTAPI